MIAFYSSLGMSLENGILNKHKELLHRQNDYKTAFAVRWQLRSFHHRQGITDQELSRQRYHEQRLPSQSQPRNAYHYPHGQPGQTTRYYNNTNTNNTDNYNNLHLVQNYQRQPTDTELLRIKKILDDEFVSAMPFYSNVRLEIFSS